MQSLEHVHAIVSDTIRIRTRLHQHSFAMFRNIEETFQMLEQIANFAAKRSIELVIMFKKKQPF